MLCGQGIPCIDLVRQVRITEQTFYRWRKQYGGMETDQPKELKLLQKENDRLRRAVSDLTLDKTVIGLKGPNFRFRGRTNNPMGSGSGWVKFQWQDSYPKFSSQRSWLLPQHFQQHIAGRARGWSRSDCGGQCYRNIYSVNPARNRLRFNPVPSKDDRYIGVIAPG